MIQSDIIAFFSHFAALKNDNRTENKEENLGFRMTTSATALSDCFKENSDSKEIGITASFDLVNITTYKKFFYDYEQLTDFTLDQFDNFFNDFMPYATLQNEYRKYNAPRFNIFSSLDISSDELIASKFIASLLDPYGTHDQGALFLRSFLSEFFSEFEISEEDANHAQVFVEKDINDFGRLDIVLELHSPEYRLIVIENKINAPESPKQIEKYQEWLKSKKGNNHKIIFLTPDGRESITKAKGADLPEVVELSYSKNLVEWFNKLIIKNKNFPERIKYAVLQFCENHNLQLPKGVVMDSRLESFLSEKLSVAWDIAEAFIEMREKVYCTFWGNVKTFIDEKIEDQSDWASILNFKVPSTLFIIYKKDISLAKVGAKRLRGESDDCCYGIWKDDEKKAVNNMIVESLKNNNFKTNMKGRFGYKKVKEEIAIELRADNKNALIALNNDNNSEDHVKAIQMADAIWGLFDKHRLQLEEMNNKIIKERET